ncbi:DUF2950 domain-containing protein [Lysobacter niabensis]|uniref:DUF2950 domain-containing protein n=1 Tax=Agrilutibacter niabensis TaxID=380628 RepID=UPI00362208ED
MKTLRYPLASALLLASGLACPPIVAAQQAYPTPDLAAQAFVDSLGTQRADQARLSALLGSDWRSFIPVEGIERADVDAFLKAYRERHVIETASDGKARLVVGKTAWTLPIPMAKSAQGWRFDTRAAVDEIRIRRIGRNELAAVQSARAYHDAQMDYAEFDRDDDGVLEYARKILSTDGKHDGLYWVEDESGEISPLGPLFGDATKGSDWHGYHFRILEAQGPSAPGGAYSYLLGDNMSRGFALVAWPAKYDDTGVMSFMISHEGLVFEKDLGPTGESQARSMKRFDPDDSWSTVSGEQVPPR